MNFTLSKNNHAKVQKDFVLILSFRKLSRIQFLDVLADVD